MNRTCLFLLAFLCFTFVYAGDKWSYPADSGYADIPTIDVEGLDRLHDTGKGVIVDVRSGIEYKTAHLKGAVNIKISSKAFLPQLKAAVAKKPGEPIIFYCNGTTCLKSPLAAKTAIKAGFQNVFSFYPGLPGWAEALPGKTILRGKPVSASNKLIPKAEFKKRCLAFDKFHAQALADPNAIVIDVRDNIQRTKKLPIKRKVLAIPLENIVPHFIAKKRNQDKTLYIFDQVGKQVQALEYDLRENGYKNYWFLKKGATSVLGKQVYRK